MGRYESDSSEDESDVPSVSDVQKRLRPRRARHISYRDLDSELDDDGALEEASEVEEEITDPSQLPVFLIPPVERFLQCRMTAERDAHPPRDENHLDLPLDPLLSSEPPWESSRTTSAADATSEPSADPAVSDVTPSESPKPPPVDDAGGDKEYLVKFLGSSYLHCRWLSNSEVEELVTNDRALRTKYKNFEKKLTNGLVMSECQHLDCQVERVLDCSDLFKALYPMKAAEISRSDWRYFCLNIIDALATLELQNIKYSIPFLRPVDEEVDGAPGYSEVVRQPMDFTSVYCKLYLKIYQQPQEFWTDTKRIFSNCFLYNSPLTDVSLKARVLEKLFDKLYSEWAVASRNEQNQAELPATLPVRLGNPATLEEAVSGFSFKKIAADSERPLLYLVKWRGLSYLEASWEKEADVPDQLKIAQYHRTVAVPEWVKGPRGVASFELELQKRMLHETFVYCKAAREALFGNFRVAIHSLPALTSANSENLMARTRQTFGTPVTAPPPYDPRVHYGGGFAPLPAQQFYRPQYPPDLRFASRNAWGSKDPSKMFGPALRGFSPYAPSYRYGMHVPGMRPVPMGPLSSYPTEGPSRPVGYFPPGTVIAPPPPVQLRFPSTGGGDDLTPNDGPPAVAEHEDALEQCREVPSFEPSPAHMSEPPTSMNLPDDSSGRALCSPDVVGRDEDAHEQTSKADVDCTQEAVSGRQVEDTTTPGVSGIPAESPIEYSSCENITFAHPQYAPLPVPPGEHSAPVPVSRLPTVPATGPRRGRPSLPAACTEVFTQPVEGLGLATQAAHSRYAHQFAEMKKPPAAATNISRFYPRSPHFKSGLQLFDYQLEGLNWLLTLWGSGRNGILADEMGLGKTIQTIALFWHLIEKEKMRGPFLVVAPLSTLDHWIRSASDWTDINTILYYDESGRPGREAIKKYEWFHQVVDTTRRSEPRIQETSHYKFQLLLTSYETFMSDVELLAPIAWQYVVIDEAHKLKNRLSKMLQLLRQIACRQILLLTGTPVQNNTEELWPLLNYIEPVRFCDIEAFKTEFGDLKSQEQVESLTELLRPHLLRRVKEDVAHSIPPLEETIIDVELTILQKAYYRAIYERHRNFLFRDMSGKKSLMNIEIELRKCCNHPFQIEGVEAREYASCKSEEERFRKLVDSSGKMVLLDKLLPKLRAEGHKVLIFSQFQQTLTLIEDFLTYRGWKYERLDGAVRGGERAGAISRFNDHPYDRFVFLLSTRAGGLGINLTSADTVIIFDSDWNPQNDVQATARAHRIGQEREVQVYRLVTARTYEARMFDRASKKLGLNTAVFRRRAFDGSKKKEGAASDRQSEGLSKIEVEELLKNGAYYLLEGGTEAARTFQESDIDDILSKNSRLVRYQLTGQANTFAKTAFKSDLAGDILVDDPDFWRKVLDLSGSQTLLSRLNDGTVLATEETRIAYMDELATAVANISVEDSPERIVKCLVQVSHMKAFTGDQRRHAAALLQQCEAALAMMGVSEAVEASKREMEEEEADETEGKPRRSSRVPKVEDEGCNEGRKKGKKARRVLSDTGAIKMELEVEEEAREDADGEPKAGKSRRKRVKLQPTTIEEFGYFAEQDGSYLGLPEEVDDEDSDSEAETRKRKKRKKKPVRKRETSTAKSKKQSGKGAGRPGVSSKTLGVAAGAGRIILQSRPANAPGLETVPEPDSSLEAQIEAGLEETQLDPPLDPSLDPPLDPQLLMSFDGDSVFSTFGNEVPLVSEVPLVDEHYGLPDSNAADT